MAESKSRITFADRVVGVVIAIPVGRVTTYGLIARAMGSPRSARIVGWTLRHTSADSELPAHRVVNRIGFLSGGWHFGHPDVMRDRLLAEGVPFRDVDEYLVDLSACLWDPADVSALDWVFEYDEQTLLDDPPR
jgi:methylated-DNA-protein-cysteine methyltransferase-like protein